MFDSCCCWFVVAVVAAALVIVTVVGVAVAFVCLCLLSTADCWTLPADGS